MPESLHEPSSAGAATPIADSEDEINLLDLFIVLAKHKTLIIGLPFVVAVIAAVMSLLMTKVYTASTTILPPQQSQSAAGGLLSQLGGLGGIAGGAFGLRSPANLYIGMLKSRRVADGIIGRFDLNHTFHQKLQSDTRSILEGMSKFVGDKDGMITIEVSDTDPKRAAELANAYVDELYKVTDVLAVTEASQRRLFFERQFAEAKDHLAKAEVAARQALEKGGLVNVDDQGRAMIAATARLRAEITVKQVQIGVMHTFASTHNPDLYRAQQELDSMKRELAKIEGNGGEREAERAAGIKGIENLNILRNLKYYETIYELLGKQYQLAKIDEAKDPALVQVLDKAVVPDRRSAPKRKRIVLLSAAVAGVIAVLLAFLKESVERVRRDPQNEGRLTILRRSLSWRRRA